MFTSDVGLAEEYLGIPLDSLCLVFQRTDAVIIAPANMILSLSQLPRLGEQRQGFLKNITWVLTGEQQQVISPMEMKMLCRLQSVVTNPPASCIQWTMQLGSLCSECQKPHFHWLTALPMYAAL